MIGTTVVALVALTALSAGAGAGRKPGAPLKAAITNPAPGATVARSVAWTVEVSGGPATRVEFAVDGAVSSRVAIRGRNAGNKTYRFGGSRGALDTSKLSNGTHTLRATAYGGAGDSFTSQVTVAVDNEPEPVAGAPVSASPPVVRGDTLVGRTLTSTEGQWDGARPMTFSWSWFRCREDACSPVDGVSGPTYTLTGDDAGYRLHTLVTAGNELGSGSESSALTGVVASPTPPPPPPSGPPVSVTTPLVRGDALVGRTLTSTEGQWDGARPMTFSWSWFRCREDVCTPVDGVSGPTYTLTGDDVGFRLRSRVTATNELGSGSESSPPTAVVTTGV